MYQEFFGFREKPFHLTPNPRFLFLSKNHREVFAHLLYGIRNRVGFIEVTGEVGTGKTTVLRTLFGELGGEGYRLAFIFNPSLSALDLLRSVNREFGLPSDSASAGELLASLNDFLLRENAAGRTVVLVIDEAQNLEPAVLEQIRLISNLETESDKLIQIVLVGQPELGRILSRPDLRQLSQRISVRYHLRPLDAEDTSAYIEHRLGVAGWKGGKLFAEAALRGIFRRSGGYPRLINVLCDRSLLVAYAEDARTVDARMVKLAVRELRREGGGWAERWRRWWWVPALAGAAALVVWLAWPGPVQSPALAQTSPTAQVAPSAPPADDMTLATALHNLDPQASTATAVDALLRLWHRPGLALQARLDLPDGVAVAAAERGLSLLRFRGDLAPLLRLDTPALLLLTAPDGSRRAVALTGVAGDRVTLLPPLDGHDKPTLAELQQLWSGEALLPWDNPLSLPLSGKLDSATEVARLQRLLAEAGSYRGGADGVADAAMTEAIGTIQRRRGLNVDGVAGPQTLLALYQEAGRYQAPRLVKTEVPQP